MCPHEPDRHVLVISHDVVGQAMAGPGIRYYHLAAQLARHFAVTLAVPPGSTLETHPDFAVLPYRQDDPAVLAQVAGHTAVVLVSSVWLARLPFLLDQPVPVVVDGYDPVLAETLSLGGADAGELQRHLALAYLRGDFFVCASERQRDWWLGLLEASGRINQYTFAADPSLRSLVDVVPFGLPDVPLGATRPVVRRLWPAIGADDRIVLWGGGLWPWLDPLTAIRAMAEVCRRRQDVRLLFPGTVHPNPDVAGIPTHAQAAVQLARELGLLDRHVFFGEWVPYVDWPGLLAECDVALTLHLDTLETRLAFRSRVLDYIWAGLPVVASWGDATAELVAQYGVGTVVGIGDAGAVARAIWDLLERPGSAFQDPFAQARRALAWGRAAEPLVAFCRHPHRAPDRDKMGVRLGNPFYVAERERLQEEQYRLAQERDRWRERVRLYEQGRFMRLMRWLHQSRQRYL